MKKFRAKQFIEDDFHNFDTALTFSTNQPKTEKVC